MPEPGTPSKSSPMWSRDLGTRATTYCFPGTSVGSWTGRLAGIPTGAPGRDVEVQETVSGAWKELSQNWVVLSTFPCDTELFISLGWMESRLC